jgi:hypothetical protein
VMWFFHIMEWNDGGQCLQNFEHCL